ncbi:hypothetical protein F5Y05DRAFT_137255 [Hypoxylon sp. FL0543]|nr:hypothetical protein F5Y05DRAFT_137255 [Hypoxylon sp. FL0543]
MPAALKYYNTPGHVVAAGVVLSLVDITSVILRFYTRKRQQQPLKADDWLLVPASLLTTGIGICLVYGVSREALGYASKLNPDLTQSSLEITSEQLTTAFRLEFSVISMIPLTLGCVKAAFLFFYRRIFSVNKKTDIFLIGMIVLVALWTVGFFFTVVFECGANFWAILSPQSTAKSLTTHCIKTMDLALAFGISDFTTDLIIICIPIPLIWRLSFSTPKKVATSAIFLLGAVSTAASLTRLLIIAKDVKAAVVYNPYEDEILVITEYLYWGMIECGIGVFAACLPTILFLLRGWSPKTVISSAGSFLGSRPSRRQYMNASQQTIHVGQTFDIAYTKNQSAATNSSSGNYEQGIIGDEYVPKTETYPMRDWRIVGESQTSQG